MSNIDPQHIDAVTATFWPSGPMTFALYSAREISRDLLSSTDPAVHAAMLDALTRHGVLTGEVAIRYEKPLATPDMDGTTVRTYTTQLTEVTAEAAMKVKAPLGATGHRLVRRVASDWQEVAP